MLTSSAPKNANALVGLDEVVHRLGVAATLVRHAALVGLGVQLQGREAADAVLLGQLAVVVSVQVGDDNVVRLLHLGELVVVADHALAVTAPRGVELDHDVLLRVHDDLVEVASVQLDNLAGKDGGGQHHDDESGDESAHSGEGVLCKNGWVLVLESWEKNK